MNNTTNYSRSNDLSRKFCGKSCKRALVIVDLPFGTYQADSKEALKSAIKIMKESGAHAVKLEGLSGKESIERIIQAGIPVMGHLGLTPQSIYKFGTYEVRAKDKDEASTLLNDAVMLEELVASLFTRENTKYAFKKVFSKLNVPIIGIGAETCRWSGSCLQICLE